MSCTSLHQAKAKGRAADRNQNQSGTKWGTVFPTNAKGTGAGKIGCACTAQHGAPMEQAQATMWRSPASHRRRHKCARSCALPPASRGLAGPLHVQTPHQVALLEKSWQALSAATRNMGTDLELFDRVHIRSKVCGLTTGTLLCNFQSCMDLGWQEFRLHVC